MYFFVRYYSWPPEQRWSCSSIKRLYLAAMYMNYLYTALNPFIYYIFIDSYRRSFQAIFGCNKLRVAAAKSSIGYALRSTNNQQTELESNLSASTVYLSSKRIYSKISSIESALQEAGMKIKSMSKTVEDANMHEYWKPIENCWRLPKKPWIQNWITHEPFGQCLYEENPGDRWHVPRYSTRKHLMTILYTICLRLRKIFENFSEKLGKLRKSLKSFSRRFTILKTNLQNFRKSSEIFGKFRK